MTMLGMLYKKLRRKVRGYSSEEFIQDLKRGGGGVLLEKEHSFLILEKLL